MASIIKQLKLKSPELTPEEKGLLEAEKVYRKGATTIRDLIAPAAMDIQFGYLRLGDFYVRSYFVYDYPRYLFTEWLSPVINFDMTMDIGMFVYPIESKKILDKLRITVARMEAAYGEQREKGLVRDPALEAQYRDAEELRDRLQAGEEKLFQFGLYFTLYATSLEQLDQFGKRLETTLGSQLVLVKQASLQHEEGFDCTLPLGTDELNINRNLDTSALSTAFPFVSSELTSNDGIMYGVNQHTNGLVLFDRFQLENANMVIFAKSGAGKSYAVKLEVLRTLMFDTEVIIIDPENEYEAMANAVGGSYLRLAITSDHRLNPFDLPQSDDAEEQQEALRANIITLHGLLSLMLGGLTPQEDNIMDRALIETYTRKGITTDPKTHHLPAPLMSDLEDSLMSAEDSKELAARIRKFTKGSFAGIFNQPTNINLTNPLVVFNIRDLEDELRPIAMYIILNYIWNRVKSERKKRLLIVDEAWNLLKFEDSAQFLYSMAKRARKYYLGLTTITQDVDDFLTSPYGKAIVTNSSLTLLLRQHPAAIDLVAKTFNLTQAEKYLLLNAEVGTGLFFAGLNHVAIQIISSYNEDQLVTTKPEELIEQERARYAETAALAEEPAQDEEPPPPPPAQKREAPAPEPVVEIPESSPSGTSPFSPPAT